MATKQKGRSAAKSPPKQQKTSARSRSAVRPTKGTAQKRPARSVPKKQPGPKGKSAPRTTLEKELRGVDDVYLTPKSIAVRKVKTDKSGRVTSDKTKYFDRTPGNMRTLRKEQGHVRTGRN